MRLYLYLDESTEELHLFTMPDLAETGYRYIGELKAAVLVEGVELPYPREEATT